MRTADGTTAPTENAFEGVVYEAQYLGETIDYLVEVEGLRLKSRQPAGLMLAAGQRVHVELPARSCALIEDDVDA